MFHSVTICGKNSWSDYHMVPVEGIYLPPPPDLKTTTIELKAADGKIDISTLLTGYPTFNNRTGTLSYFVLDPYDYDSFAEVGGSFNPDDYPSDYDVFTQIMNDLHGQYGKMVFEDDPLWEYEGRFTISGFDSNQIRKNIQINYDVKPYKLKRESTSITVNGAGGDPLEWTVYPSSGDLGPDQLGYCPTNPRITVSGLSDDTTCRIRIWKPSDSGTYIANEKYYTDRVIGPNVSNQTFAELLFYKRCRLCVLGPSTASVTFAFNQGRF